MYAIIETGGKQYRVQEGDIIDVELLGLGSDQAVAFNKVLLVQDGVTPQIGLPHLPQCIVHGELLGETKGPKVIAYKYKQRKNSRRTVGHRQRYSRVKITKIAVG
jgi:large subunit ribosomal protein L21